MPGAFTGYYLDGRSAARRPASIRLAASGLEIALEDGARLWWPFREVRQTQGFYRGEQIRLERGTPFPEILLVDDNAFLASLHATAPRFGRRFHDPRRRRTRLLLTIGAAATAVAIGAVLYVWGIPAAAGMLAARVPVSWEERLGQAAVEQITASRRRCLDRDREEAIGAIVKRLMEPQPISPYTVRVTVVDDGTVNAFAVPGGQVVLLRGSSSARVRPRSWRECSHTSYSTCSSAIRRDCCYNTPPPGSCWWRCRETSPARWPTGSRARACSAPCDTAAISRARRTSKGFGCCWLRMSIRGG